MDYGVTYNSKEKEIAKQGLKSLMGAIGVDKVIIKEGKICIATFTDGTKGRFDSRDKNTLYVTLHDNLGVFYNEKLVGNIESMNKALEKFKITLVYVY